MKKIVFTSLSNVLEYRIRASFKENEEYGILELIHHNDSTKNSYGKTKFSIDAYEVWDKQFPGLYKKEIIEDTDCKHEWINVGFMKLIVACKHCGIDKL
jgi:hypothetical protein